MEISWINDKEFPDVIGNNNRFSIDVLIYIPSLDEHTIGWYDFNEYKWCFLCNQKINGRKFMWRYFINEIDKTKYERK